MEIEIWKKIPGEKGYSVSNFGRVSSLRKILRQHKRNGFHFVAFNKKVKAVHRLVAKVFLGLDDHYIAHKDGNRENNHSDNLVACRHPNCKKIIGTCIISGKEIGIGNFRGAACYISAIISGRYRGGAAYGYKWRKAE